MSLKKIFAVSLLAAVCISVSAQEVPSFRDPGYKGSVGIATVAIGPGIETSHGWMINETHYVGAGAAACFIFPITPVFKEFIEYQVYFKKSDSTPFAGCQIGAYQTWGIDEDGSYQSGIFIEPRGGWSWLIAGRFGLTLSGGLMLNPTTSFIPIPNIHLALEL